VSFLPNTRRNLHDKRPIWRRNPYALPLDFASRRRTRQHRAVRPPSPQNPKAW
jgi:hypothetical protein